MDFTKDIPGPPSAPADWPALKAEVQARLDLTAEYRALGIRFVQDVPSAKGTLPCHALGREDAQPSAMVSVRTGIYHDSGSGESLNFWDFALKYGPFGRHIEVVRHYAEKAGVALPAPQFKSGGRIREATYLYRDEKGDVLFAVFRHRLPNGKKSFSQHPPDGKGGWKFGPGAMDGVRLVPYRLPELIAADPAETVWFVEGEKDADRLARLGLVATCNPMGAGKWRPEYAPPFAARAVIVLPDCDAPGLAHARAVCAALKPVARSVRCLDLPDLFPKGDVSDWLDAGGTLEELGRLAFRAPEWEPTERASTDDPTSDATRIATVADLRQLVAATSWLWPSWIPNSSLTLLAAEPGVGKTRFCFDLARRIFHELPWPDGSSPTVPRGGTTLWVAADNQWQELVDIPAAFALPDEAVYLNATAANPYDGTSLERDDELLDFEAHIRKVRPALVIIDTITNSGDFKSQDSSDAKRQYKPLQEIAARSLIPILCVTHLNAGGKVLGRRAVEKVRVVIQMDMPDPEGQPSRRKLWVSKSKSLPPAALGITMGDQGNDYDSAPPAAPSPERLDGATTGPPPVKTAECMGWLGARLEAGPARVSSLRDEARAEGFSAPVLYRAKDRLAILETRDEGRLWWSLPATARNGQEVPF